MGRYYEENYELLKQRLNAMASRVQEVIGGMIGALASRDAEAAQALIAVDSEIDSMELEIDELIMKLLALQQPMAVDLRFLITALKMNNDLERMGDQAGNIAQNIVYLQEHAGMDQSAPLPVDFSPMAEAVQGMVRDCLGSFATGDVALATSLRSRDTRVDELNRAITRQLAAHLHAHPEDAERCVSALLIARNFERIGDLCTNIAEDVVYYIEGKVIKHMPRVQPNGNSERANG